MQFFVFSFTEIHLIDIRPFLQRVEAALNSDPRLQNLCFSLKHAVMLQFYSSVICIIIENID